MKRDRTGDQRAGTDASGRQLASLAARLRQDGIEPARDLWPEIERALGEPATVPRSPRVRGRLWAAAGLAATVVLAVGLGLGAFRHGAPVVPGPSAAARGEGTPAAASPAASGASVPDAARQGLRAVESAYSELRAALERSPDDPELSRLVLMIHHTRGRLLRLQADDGARNALRGRS